MKETPASGAGISDWETYPHGADVGIRGFGATPADAFASVALALTAVLTDPGAVRQTLSATIDCSAPDLETLLIDWLNALVLRISVDRCLWSRFDVVIDELHLEATVHGEAIDPLRHRPAVEVKGATYTTASVAQDDTGRWCAQCVVDV